MKALLKSITLPCAYLSILYFFYCHPAPHDRSNRYLHFPFSSSISIHAYSRFHKPTSYDDDDLDSSYFRRKPTSFLSSNDAKRYTWMAPDDEAIRMEGPRPIQNGGGPYIVGSYPPKSSFLSQSSEQITG